MSWLKNSQHHSIVIPGNPGEGRGRPGIQEFQRHLDTGVRRYDALGVTNFFDKLLAQYTFNAFAAAALAGAASAEPRVRVSLEEQIVCYG